MNQTTITINDTEYEVLLSETEEEHRKGLMGVKTLPKNKGMLFVFDEVGDHKMWMKDTLIPLDLIFIDEDLEVLKVVTRKPEDTTQIGCPDTKYVLELNADSGVEVGDELELDEEEKDYSPESDIWKMKVLAPDGSILFRLQGGERIVSRKETKNLIRRAKKARSASDEAAHERLCILLGKKMFHILDKQDSREPEYVLAP